MATTVKSFPKVHRGKTPMYPWDEWLDGRVWKLRLGKDFGSRSFPTQVREAAKNRGMKVKTRLKDGDLYIQVVP